MNILEKISPGTALKRAAARKKLEMINSGYGNYGASKTKKSLSGWLYRGGSSKEDIEENLVTLRQRSRDLYYGGGIIGTGALKTMRTNVVGRGLKLKSRIDSEYLGLGERETRELETKIEREWRMYSESTDCDMQRLNNFYELQQLIFLNTLLSGDAFALMPATKRAGSVYDLRIKLVEADFVTTPPEKSFDDHIVDGVEFDNNGEIIAYHFAKYHPLSLGCHEQEYTRVLAYGERTGRPNVLHIMYSERIGQVRGVPFLSPVIEAIKQLGRYTDAELLAAVVSGMFTVFIQKGDGEGPALGEAIPEEMQLDRSDDTTLELAPGAVMELGMGETVKEANPGRPNTAFDGFVSALCRQIGAALEIPHEMLMKQFNNSYSASRAALLEGWKSFKTYREWLSSDFCRPVYEQWLTEAVAKGRIAAPGFFTDAGIRKAYMGAEWIGPAQGLLNPVQEVRAAQLRVENGFSTRDRETTEITGGDFYANARARKREEELMKEVYEVGDKKE